MAVLAPEQEQPAREPQQPPRPPPGVSQQGFDELRQRLGEQCSDEVLATGQAMVDVLRDATNEEIVRNPGRAVAAAGQQAAGPLGDLYRCMRNMIRR